MRAIHDRQITLLNGESIAPGYRGRRTVRLSNQVSTRIAIAFAAALIGFTTAATAVTVKNHSTPVARHITAGANLMNGSGGSVGFAVAVY